MKRRKFLAYSSALSATSLTGCATTGLIPGFSSGVPALDSAVRTFADGFANKLISDQIFSALGIPNRLAFVSGRPMTPEEKVGAVQAQAHFKEIGTQVPELPVNPMEFSFTAKPVKRNLARVQVTNRSSLAWPGPGDRRGREQVERASALRDQYRKVGELSIAQALELLEAHRPFFVLVHEAEKQQKNRQLSRRLLIPAQSSVVIPMRTGCLGAGLPLPRSGEGTRLIHVGAAVDSECRPMIYGLLNHARSNPDDQLDCQNLIWALVHADNSSYANLALRVSSSRQRTILDQAVPGGYTAYTALLEKRWARREDEAKKLKLAKLGLDQLNSLAGTTFKLAPPAGAAPGTPNYIRNLLQQGFDQGTTDLLRSTQGLTDELLSQGLRNTGLDWQAQNAVKTAVTQATPAITNALLGSNSPFDALQGYTLLRPGVGAHVSDIGGVAGGAQLMVANTTQNAFDFNPNELAASTPRKTQIQALWPDFGQFDNALPSRISDKHVEEAKKILAALMGLINYAGIKGIDNRVSWMFDRKGLTGFAAITRAMPVFGTLVSLHDIVSYIGSQERPPKDFFGEEMNWADFTLSLISLAPGVMTFVSAARSSAPFTRALSEVTPINSVVEFVIDGAAPLNTFLKSELVQEFVYKRLNPDARAQTSADLMQGAGYLSAYGDPASAKLVADIAAAFGPRYH